MNYELNIKNYSTNDLINFFNLPDKFTKTDLINNLESVRTKILNTNGHELDNSFKNDFSLFLQNSQDILNPFIFNEEPIIPQYSTSHPETINRNPINFSNPTNTFNTNVARGDLNVLQKRTTKKLLAFNSIFGTQNLRTVTTTTNNITNVDFTIPYKLKQVVSAKLVSLDIPQNTIYFFNNVTKTNRFYITENNTNISGLVIIPEGIYSSIEMVTALQTTINTIIGNANFVVKIDLINNKTIISNTVNTFQLEFVMADTNPNMYKNIGWLLGYRQSKYLGEKSYTSEGIFNNNLYDYLYFVFNDFTMSFTSNMILILQNSYIDNNIMGKIEYNNTNSDNNLYIKRDYFGTVDINKIQIQLLTKYGDLIDMNNMNFSFIMEFEMIYDI